MAGVNTAIFGTCVRKYEGSFHLSYKVMAVGLAMAISGVCTPASAFEPKWPAGPYKYIVIDQDLRDALVEFGRNVNIWVKVSDQIKGRRLRGPLPTGTAEQFLKQLCDSYGLVWYFDGSVLHITPENELKTEMVDVTPLTSHQLYEELKKVGVADARFPIRTTGDERVISISGPPSYLWAIRQTLATMVKAATPRLAKETPSENTPVVRVFRGG